MYDKATFNYEEALKIRIEMYGENNINTAKVYNNYSQCLYL